MRFIGIHPLYSILTGCSISVWSQSVDGRQPHLVGISLRVFPSVPIANMIHGRKKTIIGDIIFFADFVSLGELEMMRQDLCNSASICYKIKLSASCCPERIYQAQEDYIHDVKAKV